MTTPATVEEAKAGLRRAAHRGYLFRDPIVHSVGGGFGCDASLPGVLAELETAREILWLQEGERPLGYRDHELLVVDAEGRHHAYQAQREGEPLPDPPPPDTAVLDVTRLLEWIREEVVGEARSAGGPLRELVVGEVDSTGRGTDHEHGDFAITWRGRKVVVSVTVCDAP